MRSQSTLHWWYPCYCYDLARYSPGLILLLHLAQCAPDFGIRTIDLGKGNEPYKLRVRTSQVLVAEGAVVVGTTKQAVEEYPTAPIKCLPTTLCRVPASITPQLVRSLFAALADGD